MKSYRSDESVRGAWLFGLVLMSAVTVPFGFAIVAGRVEQPALAVLFVLVVVVAWYLYLTTATRIEVDDEGMVTCRAPLSTRRFAAAHVTQVRGWRFVLPHVITISYRDGSVRILGRMTGLTVLMADIKEASPGAWVDGV